MDNSEKQRDGFIEEERRRYTDLKTVESQRNDLTAEEFPEGPYGATFHEGTLGKSSPWRQDQRSPNSYTFEDREFHAGISRAYPGAHPTHDSSGDNDPEDE